MTVTTFSLSVYVLPFMKKVFCSEKNKEAKKKRKIQIISVLVLESAEQDLLETLIHKTLKNSQISNNSPSSKQG